MPSRWFAMWVALAAATGAHAAPTAEELIAKNLEARGGAAKLQAITSVHTVGTVRVGGGLDAKIESWAVAPDRYRSDFSLQGMTATQSWDGHEAWAVRPFGGRREPQKLTADDAKTLIEGADVAGPLVNYQGKGSKVEYLGTEDIDGTEAHKIRVTLKNGDTKYVFLDPDAFLEIRIVTHRMIRGQDDVSTVDLGEYEKVDGLYFPFEIGRNHLDRVELGASIDPKIFAFPAAPAR